MVRVFNLLGGMFGADGWADSRGMIVLADRLAKLPNVRSVDNYSWYDWQQAASDIMTAPTSDKKAVIGYSGGGSRATWLANSIKNPIDLMVLYDPSLAREMQPIGSNVRHGVCYHNNNPGMWLPFYGPLGGGVLSGLAGTVIETIEISEFHMLVQMDQKLHDTTVKFVEALS